MDHSHPEIEQITFFHHASRLLLHFMHHHRNLNLCDCASEKLTVKILPGKESTPVLLYRGNTPPTYLPKRQKLHRIKRVPTYARPIFCINVYPYLASSRGPGVKTFRGQIVRVVREPKMEKVRVV